MTRIADLLDGARSEGRPTVSVEFFPPKTDEGSANLARTLEELSVAPLDFVSVTYGAGGSTRDRTRDLVVEIERTRPYPAMAHLTCVGHTRGELEELLADYEANSVHNILALGGDPPADGSPVTGDFSYAMELVRLVRSRGDRLSVGVAAHPELHPRSTDRASDRRHLADKLEVADFGITQFFFDPAFYFRMVEDLDELGCRTPVLPGIMPMSNPTGIRRMASMAGASFPEDLAAKVEEAEEPERHEIVADAAAELCRDLLAGGAPGVHIYCLNRSATALAVLERLDLLAD